VAELYSNSNSTTFIFIFHFFLKIEIEIERISTTRASRGSQEKMKDADIGEVKNYEKTKDWCRSIAATGL